MTPSLATGRPGPPGWSLPGRSRPIRSPRRRPPPATRAPVERVTGGPGRRGAGRARGYRCLRRHRAGPARLPVRHLEMPRGQLARRDAPHPGGPAALPGAVGRLRAGRVHAALLRRLRRRRPACSASPTCRCGWCRWCPRWPASRSWPGWSSARRAVAARGWRRGPAGRDLLRHLHVVRRRPGRLAVPGAERRRACTPRAGCAAPAGRSSRACCSEPRSSRSRPRWRRGRGPRWRSRRGPRRRLAVPAALAYARRRRRQHARARAGQPRLVRVLRLRADEPARAQPQRRQPVLGQ